MKGRAPAGTLTVEGPEGWTVTPARAPVDARRPEVTVRLAAPAEVPVEADKWPMRNIFTARLEAPGESLAYEFGVAGAGLWRLLGIFYDAVPDEGVPAQARRKMNHHFVSLTREYLPEPDVDVAAQYEAWSRKLGRPALLASYEHEVDVTRLVGLTGAYCAYVARTVVSPEERRAYAVVGNNDGYRFYLNGERIAEVDERICWTPFNNIHEVTLRKGPNRILLKLLKRTDRLVFTFGLREGPTDENGRRGHNMHDWLVDLADAVSP